MAIYRLQLNKDSGAVLEGKFCGDTKPQSIKIEESSMTVQFISDVDSISSPHTGFSLHFETNFKDCKLESMQVHVFSLLMLLMCLLIY